jgi:excisionase family DNA binding protein
MEEKAVEKKNTRAVAPIAGADALCSVQEVCATLSIGPTKCWELISQGQLSVVRLGARCTRIRKSSMERLIQNGLRVG